MNDLGKKGPINLDNSAFMPKQAMKQLEQELEEIKQAHEPEQDRKDDETKPEETAMVEEDKDEKPKEESPMQEAPNLDSKKINRIQYIGKKTQNIMCLFNIKIAPAIVGAQNPEPEQNQQPEESDASESVYETESSQQPSNFVLGFQK